MNPMTPEDRISLAERIAKRMDEMTDEELKALAEEIGAEEAIIEDPEKAVSKELADAAMSESVVDTGVLTGPRGGLKNFLLKSSREKEKESKS